MNKQTESKPRPGDPLPAYILRIRTSFSRIWLVTNGVHDLKGAPGTSRKHVQDQFAEMFGSPSKWIRFVGVHSTAEAACSMASIREEVGVLSHCERIHDDPPDRTS